MVKRHLSVLRMFDRLAVDLLERVQRRFGTEVLAPALVGALTQPLGSRVVGERLDGFGPGVGIIRRSQEARDIVAHVLRKAVDVARDHRHARGQRLDQRLR